MSIFRYRGYDRLFHKIQKGYKGYVQDHHVIPREFRRHRLITKLNYDINGRDNLFIMPNNKGIVPLAYLISRQNKSHDCISQSEGRKLFWREN